MIFQVRDDGANGTHGFAMVLSVIALNEDPSDLSWFSLDGVCRGFDFLHGSTALPPIHYSFSVFQVQRDGSDAFFELVVASL